MLTLLFCDGLFLWRVIHRCVFRSRSGVFRVRCLWHHDIHLSASCSILVDCRYLLVRDLFHRAFILRVRLRVRVRPVPSRYVFQ